MKLPKLDGPAKAQLWGLAFSFALALLACDRMGLSLAIYAVGCGLSWAAWEFAGARRFPANVPVGLVSGLLIPWGGFLLTYGLHALRP